MKICLFDHHDTPYPIQQYGGIERVNQNLFTYLVDQGIDTTLIINDNNNFKYKNGNVIQLPFSVLEDIRYGRVLISEYTDADIFHSHTSGQHQSFDFTNFKGKWVATCHGYKEDAAAPYQVFISESQFNQHNQEYNSTERSGVCYLAYNGVDTYVLYSTEHDKKRIIWYAGIRYDKNIHILPKLVEKIHQTIYIYGKIQDQMYFDNYIEPYLSERLQYCGPISSEEEKREMFSTAKLYLHTTQEFQEPFGLTILEAQACGVPVVGFRGGSLPEVVCNADVNLVDTLEEMVQLINNESYSKNTKEIRERVIKKFSVNSFGKTYLRIYKHILEDNTVK